MTDQYGEFVGVSNLHVAVGVADSASAYQAPPNQYLAPASSVAQEPSVNTKTRYYDNKPLYITSTESETKITMVVSGVPTQMAAQVLGKGYDPLSKRILDNGVAAAPWCALSFKSDVEGGCKYYQYLKGKFAPFNEEASSKTTDTDEKTTTLVYTAASTTYEGFDIPKLDGSGYEKGPLKRIVADNRLDPSLTDEFWFSMVQTSADATASASAEDKQELANLLTVAGDLDEEKYSADSWAVLVSAREAATAAQKNGSSKAQVVKATVQLRAAIQNLISQ